MDHFTSPEPPHPDVRRAVAADLLALANYDNGPPLSIAEIHRMVGRLAAHPDENGRATVMLATGDLQAMDLSSISVPDAHRLIAALEHALSEPLANAS